MHAGDLFEVLLFEGWLKASMHQVAGKSGRYSTAYRKGRTLISEQGAGCQCPDLQVVRGTPAAGCGSAVAHVGGRVWPKMVATQGGGGPSRGLPDGSGAEMAEEAEAEEISLEDFAGFIGPDACEL